jgi:hypothetical protein
MSNASETISPFHKIDVYVIKKCYIVLSIHFIAPIPEQHIIFTTKDIRLLVLSLARKCNTTHADTQ